jgi:rhamnulokinase
VLGALRTGVAAQAGLGPVSVVAPATHDTASAVAAVPAVGRAEGSWAYISSGTWSLVGIENPVPCLGTAALEANLTNEGGVDGTWRVLKNVMGLWLVQRCRRAFEERGGTTDYARLVELAAAAPARRSRVDPDDPGFLNPPDMPAALQGWCRATGQPVPESEGALVRCVLESLAVRYAEVIEQLERVSGRRIEVIHIVGGGCRNALLNQFTADACQRPVLAGPVEATVLGNILVQARALGALGSGGELREIVRRSGEPVRFEPNPAEREAWAEFRGRNPVRRV